MSSFVFGILGGIVAWVATTIVAQPLKKFLDLRAEAARLLALYGDEYDFTQNLSHTSTADWLAERKKAYAACSAELTGFAFSNSLATRILHRSPIKSLRCYPRNAGTSLWSLSEATPGTGAAAELANGVKSALRLTYRP